MDVATEVEANGAVAVAVTVMVTADTAGRRTRNTVEGVCVFRVFFPVLLLLLLNGRFSLQRSRRLHLDRPVRRK